MQLLFTFKQMETSEALKDLTRSKIFEKIERYSTKPIEAHITFSVERHEHFVQCTVKGGDGFSFTVEGESLDMYSSVDLMVLKLEAKLRKQKERLKNHKFKNNLRHLKPKKENESWDSSPIDAEDIIKYEQARMKRVSGQN